MFHQEENFTSVFNLNSEMQKISNSLPKLDANEDTKKIFFMEIMVMLMLLVMDLIRVDKRVLNIHIRKTMTVGYHLQRALFPLLVSNLVYIM